VPLPETVEKFGLLDDHAIAILKAFDLESDNRMVSN
jgi:hypothetical protein